MTWEKLPVYTGEKHVGCLTCTDGTPDIVSMDMIIAVGFGYAGARCDGEEVYREPMVDPSLECENDNCDGEYDWVDRYVFCPKCGGEPTPIENKTLADIEAMAIEDPDHDWRVILDGPLRGRTYQRQGEKFWILVDSNRGFA